MHAAPYNGSIRYISHAYPEKQGLKPWKARTKFYRWQYQPRISRKTRIETWRFPWGLRCPGSISHAYPEKQGLKHGGDGPACGIAVISHAYPEKQGLKPIANCISATAGADQPRISRKTRIETPADKGGKGSWW